MKREQGRKILWLVVLFLMAFPIGDVWGLTDEEIFRDFQFNFIIPGARSTGLGGAFIAAADDATAAEANPAALHYVIKNEVFAEYRLVRPETQVFDATIGSNTFDSPDAYLDGTSVTERADQDFVSFLSYAYPFKIGWRRATVAFSRLVLLNVDSILLTPGRQARTGLDISLPDWPIVPNTNPSNPDQTERYRVNNNVTGFLDAEILHYNASFEFSMTRDFSFGLTATYAQLTMNSNVESKTIDDYPVLQTIHPRVDLGGGELSEVRFRTSIDDTDSAFTYSIGLHWHPDSAFSTNYSPLRFGLVYRRGAEFEVTEVAEEWNPADDEFQPFDPLPQFANVIKVPDRWGFGVSYEAGKHWLISFDLERIKYSDLLEGFRPNVNFFTIPGRIESIDVAGLEFDVDDATVPHFGVEYGLASRGGWTHYFRIGYFNDPDSTIRLVSIDTGDPTVDEFYLDLFGGGEDVDHYTVGFSFGLPNDVFSVQFAGDFSDVGNQGVISLIGRFGKPKR